MYAFVHLFVCARTDTPAFNMFEIDCGSRIPGSLFPTEHSQVYTRIALPPHLRLVLTARPDLMSARSDLLTVLAARPDLLTGPGSDVLTVLTVQVRFADRVNQTQVRFVDRFDRPGQLLLTVSFVRCSPFQMFRFLNNPFSEVFLQKCPFSDV